SFINVGFIEAFPVNIYLCCTKFNCLTRQADHAFNKISARVYWNMKHNDIAALRCTKAILKPTNNEILTCFKGGRHTHTIDHKTNCRKVDQRVEPNNE